MKNITIALCLVAGLAGGFCLDRFVLAPKAPAPQPVADDGAAARLAKAEKRIADLEKQLADSKSRSMKAQAAAAAAEQKARETAEAKDANDDDKVETIEVKNGNMMDALKGRLSPEQYTQVSNAFEQFKTKLAMRVKSKQDYLNSIDTSNMSEKDKATHARYLELFAKREEIAAKMQGGIPNRNSLREMMQIGMEIAPVAKEERNILMRQVAGELGYSGDDATVIGETIQNIYDCTSSGPLSGFNDMIETATSIGGGAILGQPRVETQVITIGDDDE